MSVFQLSPRQVKEQLEELPPTHTKEEIFALIDKLQTDIRNDPPGLDFLARVRQHADHHKELFFSYPMLYRSICKGTYRPVVVDILLDARQAMESGQKSKKEALDEVIRKSVDEVTRIRQEKQN